MQSPHWIGSSVKKLGGVGQQRAFCVRRTLVIKVEFEGSSFNLWPFLSRSSSTIKSCRRNRQDASLQFARRFLTGESQKNIRRAFLGITIFFGHSRCPRVPVTSKARKCSLFVCSSDQVHCGCLHTRAASICGADCHVALHARARVDAASTSSRSGRARQVCIPRGTT